MRIAALGTGCSAAVVLAEILLRVLQLSPSQAVGTVTEAEFSRYPGLFTPGQELLSLEKPALPYQVRINSLGYRGEDFLAHKPSGEFRVLTVGDSFTYGDFVDNDETLPARLELGLRRLCGAVTVINGGVGGTTLLTHQAIVDRALHLDPDLVLLIFSENDIGDLADPMLLSLAENRRRKSRFPLRFVYPLLRHTAIWNFALNVRARLAAQARDRELDVGPGVFRERADLEPSAKRREQRKSSLRAEYARRLDELQSALAAAKVPFALAIYPSHHSVSDSHAREQLEWLSGIGKHLGIDSVSLLDVLEATGEPIDALYLLPWDGPPSPLGYSLSADELLRRLNWAGYSAGDCDQ